MTLKWIALLKKITKTARWLGASTPNPHGFGSRVARNLQWGDAVSEVKTRKKGHHQRSSKSLLGVRRKKGRVSFKKKGLRRKLVLF